MSKWSGRPVKNKSSPREAYPKSAYRSKAFPYLCKDFEDRCAYSLVHIKSMAKMVMEVDHFDPRIKQKSKQPYSNLVIAYRPCNNHKRAIWPVKSQRELGVRYLNPRQDIDYGVHIFEDPDTNKLFGVTPAGKWHVEKLALNDDYLVEQRRLRSRWEKLIAAENNKVFVAEVGQEPSALSALKEVQEQYAYGIPKLPLREKTEPDLDDLERAILGE